MASGKEGKYGPLFFVLCSVQKGNSLKAWQVTPETEEEFICEHVFIDEISSWVTVSVQWHIENVIQAVI